MAPDGELRDAEAVDADRRDGPGGEPAREIVNRSPRRAGDHHVGGASGMRQHERTRFRQPQLGGG